MSPAAESTDRTHRDLSDAPPWDGELLAFVRTSLEQQLARWASLPVPREDLIGEVLLRLLASDPRAIESPQAYAVTILRNLIRDKIRHLERARRLLGDVATSQTRAFESRQRPHPVDEGDLLEYLLTHTDLSPLQEKVISMMYVQGRTITEVARDLGKNPGTVQRHHERAIEKLAASASRAEYGR